MPSLCTRLLALSTLASVLAASSSLRAEDVAPIVAAPAPASVDSAPAEPNAPPAPPAVCVTRDDLRPLLEYIAKQAADARAAADTGLIAQRRANVLRSLERERDEYSLVWPVTGLVLGAGGLATAIAVDKDTVSGPVIALAVTAGFFGVAGILGGGIRLAYVLKKRRAYNAEIDRVALAPVRGGAQAQVRVRF